MADPLRCEVLVVGAGPAGLAAAVAASSKRSHVVMVDENPHAGGQIWRQMGDLRYPLTERWLAQLFREKAHILSSASVFDLIAEDTAAVLHEGHRREIRFDKMVLATGARELFLPFPGWTLPGVMGVGGLQALAKQGLSIGGKRIVVAGTGPLLLAVAKHLGKQGAKVEGIYEQARPGSARDLTLSLWRFPQKLRQAISFYWTVQKMKPGWWVREAIGKERVTTVEVTDGKRTKRIECDYLACAYGLIPNIELAQLADCRIESGFVAVDDDQRTSQARIYAAGEIVEIGGVEAAIVQGTISGLAAVGSPIEARHYHGERKKCHNFAVSLEKAYRLRPEILRLAREDTVVCRCEDVRFAALSGMTSFREAKLQTRLGMGPCQGRVCGAACRALFGWDHPGVRPPLLPVPLSALSPNAEADGSN